MGKTILFDVIITSKKSAKFFHNPLSTKSSSTNLAIISWIGFGRVWLFLSNNKNKIECKRPSLLLKYKRTAISGSEIVGVRACWRRADVINSFLKKKKIDYRTFFHFFMLIILSIVFSLFHSLSKQRKFNTYNTPILRKVQSLCKTQNLTISWSLDFKSLFSTLQKSSFECFCVCCTSWWLQKQKMKKKNENENNNK